MIELTEFAEICYKKKTIEELLEDIRNPAARKSDCKKWDLTDTEWRNALWMALLKRLQNIAEGVPNDLQARLPYDSSIKQDLQWLSEL